MCNISIKLYIIQNQSLIKSVQVEKTNSND